MSSCSPISSLNFSLNSLPSSGSPKTEISFENVDFKKFEESMKEYSSRNQILKSSSSLNSVVDFDFKKTSLEGSVSLVSIFDKVPKINFLNINNSSLPKDYSSQFNYFDNLEKENEKIKAFCERRNIDNNKYSWEGNCWSTSFGKSTDYIKDTFFGQLHIHAPEGFITGAKLFDNMGEHKISNYEAAMLDLLKGVIHKEKNQW